MQAAGDPGSIAATRRRQSMRGSGVDAFVAKDAAMSARLSRFFLRGAMRPLIILVLGVALAACAGTASPSKQELILGTWSGDFQGQSIVLTYTATEVSVEAFGISFPYVWVDADSIRLDAMGQEITSTVEFQGPDVMVQRSPQGIQTLQRVQ
jgi:hypothetical protein